MIGTVDTGLSDMQKMDLRLNLVHEKFQVACRMYHEILMVEDDQNESEAYCIYQTLGKGWQYGFV